MNAWKDFFKNNLDTILHPDLIASTFGNQYKTDLDNLSKDRPELYPWEDASLLLDRQDSNTYINTLLTNEEKNQARIKKTALKKTNGNYINAPLYDLAEKLSKQCSQFTNNRFKVVNEHKKTSRVSPPKATGAKIKNPETIEQVRQILAGKNIEETDTSYIPEDTYDDYYDMAA